MSWRDDKPSAHDPTETRLDILLRDESYRFQFFQAVRLLHLLRPEKAGVGLDEMPGKEALRFVARTTVEFPASEIHELRFPDDPHEPPRLMSSFMGLAG